MYTVRILVRERNAKWDTIIAAVCVSYPSRLVCVEMGAKTTLIVLLVLLHFADTPHAGEENEGVQQLPGLILLGYINCFKCKSCKAPADAYEGENCQHFPGISPRVQLSLLGSDSSFFAIDPWCNCNCDKMM